MINKEIKIRKSENKIRQEWKNILFNCIFASFTLLIIILFYQKIILATALEGILSIVGLVKWKSKLTLLIFIFVAFLGAAAEMSAVYFGVWQYSLSNIINIPLWLYLVWGNSGAFIYQTAIELKRLGVGK